MRRSRRYLSALLLATLISSCSDPENTAPTIAPAATIAPTALPQPSAAPAAPQPTTTLPQSGAAPGDPIGVDVWTPGNKQGVGTAFTYDQPAGEGNSSRTWFGITDGAITEGLYPDISQANIKSLGVLVTDGKSFLADE